MIYQHQMTVRPIWGLVLVFAGVSLIGCSGGSTNLSGLVPVKGVVKYNGAPVEGASVMFLPDGGATAQQRSASGTTDSHGEFALMTLQPKDGIFPGNYKVVVSKMAPDKVLSREQLEDRSLRTGPPTFTNKLPKKYETKESTPLSMTFEKKGNKEIVLELTD